ncbi:MAG: TlpA family protein disulfide reductase [Spirochaetota bacterium]
MTYLRAIPTIIVVLLLATAPALLAGGQGEPSRSETARRDSPQAERNAAPPAQETDPQETDAPDTDAAGTTDLLPMDDATAQTLARMGMMPLERKVPSEDFELALLGGGRTSLAEHEGKVVFLNFWATWCSPCREEMPSMQLLYDELAEEGLELLAVNVLESADTADAFIAEQGFTYPVLLDTNGRVMMRYGIRAYPTTYLIDRDGYVIGTRPGYHDWSTEEVVAAMRTLLAAE